MPVLLVGCKTDIREKAKENGTYVPENFVESAEVSANLTSQFCNAKSLAGPTYISRHRRKVLLGMLITAQRRRRRRL